MKKRPEALIAEATVDCYNESEQFGGIFTMMEENLTLPFKTKILGVDLPLPRPRPAGAEWIDAYRLWRK